MTKKQQKDFEKIVSEANIMALPEIIVSRQADLNYSNYLKEKIAETFNVNIKSNTRKQAVCEARQVFMYVMRKKTGFSLESIGRMVGRDHATCLHSCNNVASLLANDKKYRSQYASFIESQGVELPMINRKEKVML